MVFFSFFFEKGLTGNILVDGNHVYSDPIKAKERLVKEGVDFTMEDGEEAILSEDRLTYYVLMLVYELVEDK